MDGLKPEQIAVLVYYKTDVDRVRGLLAGTGVFVNTIHGFKGMEMEAVIIPMIEKTFTRPDNEIADRRLLYMAMSRARSRLYLTYTGRLPKPFEELHRQGLADRLE